MALDPIPVADDIATFLYGNPLGAAGTEVSLANIKILWEGIVTRLYNDIKANADVVPTAHSGENLSSPTGQPIDVTSGPGSGSSGATTADAEVVGKGSIT